MSAPGPDPFRGRTGRGPRRSLRTHIPKPPSRPERTRPLPFLPHASFPLVTLAGHGRPAAARIHPGGTCACRGPSLPRNSHRSRKDIPFRASRPASRSLCRLTQVTPIYFPAPALVNRRHSRVPAGVRPFPFPFPPLPVTPGLRESTIPAPAPSLARMTAQDALRGPTGREARSTLRLPGPTS